MAKTRLMAMGQGSSLWGGPLQASLPRRPDLPQLGSTFDGKLQRGARAQSAAKTRLTAIGTVRDYVEHSHPQAYCNGPFCHSLVQCPTPSCSKASGPMV